MSRSTQIMGISFAAFEYLRKHAAVTSMTTCKECGHVRGGEMTRHVYDQTTGRKEGMFEDGPDLYEYDLKDGSKAREVVQAVHWSSGPVIFLCLQLSNGSRVGEWSAEEISEQ